MHRILQAQLYRLAVVPRSIAGLTRLAGDYERLRASEARFRDLYENAPLAYFNVDTDGNVQGANRRARQLLEDDGGSLTGKHVLELYADSTAGREKAMALFERFMAGLSIDGEELEMRRLSGESVWVSLTVEPITDASGQVIASRSAVVDVSQRRALEEELRTRLRLDPLTGALNHAAIVEEIDEWIASSRQSMTVCMVDLDGFKAINDTYGHLAGDEVLKQVAHTLAAAGGLVGRFGGDEFLALVAGPLDKARFFARQVREGLAGVDLGGRKLPVEASFGFACYPDDATTATELIRVADTDMYSTRRASQPEGRAEAV